MLRALSIRRSRRYERLGDESAIGFLEAKLKRAKSVPARMFGSGNRLAPEQAFTSNVHPVKPTKKTAVKSHPLFSLFDGRRKKKTTATPEFARYLEYVKEGGIWDMKANMPVIHYNK